MAMKLSDAIHKEYRALSRFALISSQNQGIAKPVAQLYCPQKDSMIMKDRDVFEASVLPSSRQTETESNVTVEMNYEDHEVPFAASFPLPFRVLFLAGVGILGWATNLHGLEAMGVNGVSAMDLTAADIQLPRSPLPVHLTERRAKNISNTASFYRPVYRLFVAYAIWYSVAWSVFRLATYKHPLLVDVFRYIPACATLFAMVALISPFHVFEKRERDAFLQSIKRCLFPPAYRPIHFSDVIFADILTSYAKVLGDVWLSLCMVLPGNSLLIPPTQDGLVRWILPSIMSLPYLVRLRQCLVEHSLPGNHGKRHLLNAIKYATSFPVIYLSAAQRIVVSELVEQKGEEQAKEPWHGEHMLFRLWLMAAAVNSVYSFWWDITNDWGLDLLTFKSQPPVTLQKKPSDLSKQLHVPTLHVRSPSGNIVREDSEETMVEELDTPMPYPYGLRPTLLYPLPVYPLAVFLNLILRLTWSVKLSSHLHWQSEGSVVIFWLEMAELVRRWMWVFIRVEWEVVRPIDVSKLGGLSPRVSLEEESYELFSSGRDHRNDVDD